MLTKSCKAVTLECNNPSSLKKKKKIFWFSYEYKKKITFLEAYSWIKLCNWSELQAVKLVRLLLHVVLNCVWNSVHWELLAVFLFNLFLISSTTVAFTSNVSFFYIKKKKIINLNLISKKIFTFIWWTKK